MTSILKSLKDRVFFLSQSAFGLSVLAVCFGLLDVLAALFDLSAVKMSRDDRCEVLRRAAVMIFCSLFVFSFSLAESKDSSILENKENTSVSLCVLPFFNRDESGASSWHGTLLADLFTYSISQVSFVRVLERQALSEMSKEIELGQLGVLDPLKAAHAGKTASMDYVVFGSFLSSDNRISVEAHVVDVHTGTLVGAVVYEGDQEGITAWIPEAAEKLLGQIKGKTDPSWYRKLNNLPTRSYTAFEQFYRGMLLVDANNGLSALPFFLKASRTDPHFAPALYWTGRVYEMLGDAEHAVLQYARLSSATSLKEISIEALCDVQEQLLSHNMVTSFANLVQVLTDQGIASPEIVLSSVRHSGVAPTNSAFVNYISTSDQVFRVGKTDDNEGNIQQVVTAGDMCIFAAPDKKLVGYMSSAITLVFPPPPPPPSSAQPSKVFCIPVERMKNRGDVKFDLVDEVSCGRLLVKSNPYNADISVNGRSTGKLTPGVIYLKEGEYSLFLKYSRYVPMVLREGRYSGYNKTGKAGPERITVAGGSDTVFTRDISFDPYKGNKKKYEKPIVDNQSVIWQSGRRCLTRGFACHPPMVVSVLPKGNNEIYFLWSLWMEFASGVNRMETWMAQGCRNFEHSYVYPVNISKTETVLYPRLTYYGGKFVLVFWDKDGSSGKSPAFRLRFATSTDARHWEAGGWLDGASCKFGMKSILQSSRYKEMLDFSIHKCAGGRPFVARYKGGVWDWNGKSFVKASDPAVRIDGKPGQLQTGVLLTWRDDNKDFAVLKDAASDIPYVSYEDKWPCYKSVKPLSWDFTKKTARERKHWCNGCIKVLKSSSEGVLVTDGFDAWTVNSLVNAISVPEPCDVVPVWSFPKDYQTLIGAGLERMQVCLHGIDIGQAPDGTVYRALLGCYEGSMNHPMGKRLYKRPFLVVGHKKMDDVK